MYINNPPVFLFYFAVAKTFPSTTIGFMFSTAPGPAQLARYNLFHAHYAYRTRPMAYITLC